VCRDSSRSAVAAHARQVSGNSELIVARHNYRSPLGAVIRGVGAGAIGTLAMTAWQELAGRLGSSGGEGGSDAPSPQSSDPWEEAPVPAKVARRIGEGVLGRVSSDLIPLLRNVMHRSYGTGWGIVYGIRAGSVPRSSVLRSGALFGTGVWVASYHLVYGTGTSVGFELLDHVNR
jgi:hypothetical protein